MSQSLDLGRLCWHNFKLNRFSILVRIYAGIIGTFSWTSVYVQYSSKWYRGLQAGEHPCEIIMAILISGHVMA